MNECKPLGRGSRVHLSAMKGCIPVMIQPHTAAVLEEALDFNAFGVRVHIAVRRYKQSDKYPHRYGG